MITITDRPARLGSSINTRTEKHGDEDIPSADIPITGIMLSAEELNSLLGDPHASRALFNNDKGVKRPMFRCFKPFRLTEKFEGARVSLALSVLNDNGVVVEIKDCKLAKIDLEPCEGGLTAMSLQIQSVPTEAQIGELFGHLNREISIEIADGKRVEKSGGKQAELPMNHDQDDRVE